MEYDVFICYASEDKAFVEPVAQALISKGLKVWYDRFELKMGDSLRQEIDHGLVSSRYGTVVLSKNFFKKQWPQSELNALAGRQNAEGRKVILPIWHEIEADEVRKYSPLLADLLAARSEDGLESIVGQIINVCSEPDQTKPRSIFQTSGNVGLREKCLDILRRGDRAEWVKVVDELQTPIDQQLIAWKQDGEASIQQGASPWKESLLRATKICIPGFVPLFASLEAGQKDHWKDSVRILHRLTLLQDKMGGGITRVLSIGWNMLYVAGSIGMAIAVETAQYSFVWDWMRMKMPGYRDGTETQWAEITSAFRPPVGIDFRDPFRFLLDLCHSEHIGGFFPSEERMKEFLSKANLLQSIIELRLLTRTQQGAEIVEKRDDKYKFDMKVTPFWCLIEPADFRTWTWDLFGSSQGFISFFLTDAQGHIDPGRIWNWWKGWKVICEALSDDVTQHRAFPHTEWLMLPGEPADTA